MLRVAFIGCGSISVVHRLALLQVPDIQVVAVCDIIPERAQQAADGDAAVYTDWEEMLVRERPDVVHIMTPHYLHTPMACRALEMGIHVLLEKPCAMTHAQLRQLQQAQKRSKAQLGTCFQNRYHTASQYVRQVVTTQQLGKLEGARAMLTWQRDAAYYQSEAWRGTQEYEGGGVLINQAIHTLDLLQYFCGPVTAVSAYTANASLQGVIAVEDTACAVLEFSQGIRGVFFATVAHTKNTPVFVELHFQNATLRMEQEAVYKINADGEMTQISVPEQEMQMAGKRCWGNGHPALLLDFYDCIRNNRPFAVDAFSGGAAVEMVLAMYESAAQQKRIVL